MTRPTDPDLLDRVLPFHFRMGQDLVVDHLGPSLGRITPAIAGWPVDRFCRVERPRGVALSQWASIEQLFGRPVTLTVLTHGTTATLRGGFLEHGPGALFAGSLVADDFDDLTSLGLTLRDFAHWDAAPDAAAMNRLRRRSAEDSRTLLADLRAALEANEELRAAEAGLERDLQLAADLRMRIDVDGLISDIESSGTIAAVGVDEQRLLGQPVTSLSPTLAAIIAETGTRRGRTGPVGRVVELEDGAVFLEVRTGRLHDGTVLLVARDVTADAVEREELRAAAEEDPLTGLPNRRVFWDELASALAGSELVWALVIDIDDFKAINDRHGHHVGDEVLCRTAARLKSSVRRDDVVARLGGDEFAVLLRNADRAQAEQVADRIAEALRSPVHADDVVVAVSGSIGGAPARNGMTPDDVVASADLAMYGSRRIDGAGRVGWFDERTDWSARRRRELTADLVSAVDNGELEVWFQPMMHLADGQLAGVEALARWTHPEKGPIPPVIFIELAERARIVHQLDMLIMEKAIGAYRAIAEAGIDRPHLGFNISPLSLSQDLADRLREAVSRHEVPWKRLVLEITETTFLRDLPAAAAILNELFSSGISIALDDFGTGYSSLTHLLHLPINIVKVDRSFVSNIDADPRARQLVAGAVGMANASGATAVAEGVETPSQARFLEEIGCWYAQGHLWSPPVPVDELPTVVAILGAQTVR